MYKKTTPTKTKIRAYKVQEGETIEQKMERIINNKEPISDSAPIIYTERKDGVLPAYDIRTDRFEVAVDAHDYIQKSNAAKREERQKLRAVKDEPKDTKTDGGAEPIQGTKP